jgi:hypothetical protein
MPLPSKANQPGALDHSMGLTLPLLGCSVAIAKSNVVLDSCYAQPQNLRLIQLRLSRRSGCRGEIEEEGTKMPVARRGPLATPRARGDNDDDHLPDLRISGREGTELGRVSTRLLHRGTLIPTVPHGAKQPRRRES